MTKGWSGPAGMARAGIVGAIFVAFFPVLAAGGDLSNLAIPFGRGYSAKGISRPASLSGS